MEIPVRYSRLREIAADKLWRDKNMQYFDMGSAEQVPRYCDFKELEKTSLEYCGVDRSCSPTIMMQDQIFKGRYDSLATVFAEEIKGRNEDSFEYLEKNAKDIASNKTGGKYFAFIINDDVGLIKQLNYLRYTPLEDFYGHFEKAGNDYSKNDLGQSCNVSDYKWFLSVRQFRDVLSKMPVRDEKISDDFVPNDIPYMHAYEKERKESLDGKIAYKEIKEKVSVENNEIETAAREKYKDILASQGLEAYNKRINFELNDGLKRNYKGWSAIKLQYEKQWETARKEDKELKKYAFCDLERCYSKEAYENIERAEKSYISEINENVDFFDTIYSWWVKNRIKEILNICDYKDHLHGFYSSKVISSILQYGILGKASEDLWKWIHNSKVGRDILVAAYSGGNEKIKNAMAQLFIHNFSEKSIDLGDLESFYDKYVDAIKDLWEKVDDARVHIKNKHFKALIYESEVKDYYESLRHMHALFVSTRVASWGKQAENKIRTGQMAIADVFSQNQLLATQYIVDRIENSHPDLKNSVGGRLKYFALDVTRGELEYFSKMMASLNNSEVDYILNRASAHLGADDEFGGNFHNVNRYGGERVTLYFAAKPDDGNEIKKEYIKRKRNLQNGVDAIIESCQEDLRDDKIKFKSKWGLRILTVTSLYNSFSAYLSEGNFDDLWASLTSVLTLFQFTAEEISLMYARQAIALEGAELKIMDAKLIRKARFSSVEKSLGIAVTLMALYDFNKGMIEASDMAKNGDLSGDISRQKLSTAVSFIGTVVIGLVVTSVLAGLCLGFVLLCFVSEFNRKSVLPKYIENWLRRSKYGVDGDMAPGLKFRSMDEEQKAIGMVWKGIYINVKVETGTPVKTHRALGTISSNGPADGQLAMMDMVDIAGKNVSYKVSLPKGEDIQMLIERQYQNTKTGFWYLSEKDKKSNVARGFYPVFYSHEKMRESTTLLDKDKAKNSYLMENDFVHHHYKMTEMDIYRRVKIVTVDDYMDICFYPFVTESEGERNFYTIDFSEFIAVENPLGEPFELDVNIWIGGDQWQDKYRTIIYMKEERTV